MELVANVWPVVDEDTGLVQRYFMRAYAMCAEEQVLSATLNALAPTDFRMARGFKIAVRFKLVSEYGTLDGAVSIHDFHEYMHEILEEGFKSLEKDYAALQGIDMSSGSPRAVNVIPRFPKNPYIVTTTLIEKLDGQLLPQFNR